MPRARARSCGASGSLPVASLLTSLGGARAASFALALAPSGGNSSSAPCIYVGGSDTRSRVEPPAGSGRAISCTCVHLPTLARFDALAVGLSDSPPWYRSCVSQSREGRELRARKRSECESAPRRGTTERSCFPRLLTLAALHPPGSSRWSGPIVTHRQRRAVDRVRRAHAQVQSQPFERERTSRFLRPRAASRSSASIRSDGYSSAT